MKNKKLPVHLGGHMGRTHTDDGVLKYFIKNYSIKTYVDLGCGPGGQVEVAKSLGLDAYGIDGDYSIERSFPCIIYDFTKGKIELPFDSFDLCWTVEFVEHVEEQYIENYFPVFEKSKYIVLTHALPGEKGHHHVNCQVADYWIEKLSKIGHVYDEELTKVVRNVSNMKRDFIRRRGLVFRK